MAMTEEDQRSRALAAASQGSEAVAALIRFAREGADYPHPFGQDEVVEQLLDAAKMAIEIEHLYQPPDEERGQVYAAVCKYLEGWA